MPEEKEVVETPEVVETEQKPEVVVNKQWFDEFDPDLKSNPSITKFKSPAEIAKSYVELQKALGKDKVVLPTDKSTPEEWRAFYKKLGAPDKDDEYDVSDEELPEQARTDGAVKEAFRKAMHGQGLTKKQFEGAWKFYKESTLNRINQHAESLKSMRGGTEAELRQEWGAAYEPKVAGAQKVIDTFFKDKGIRPEFSVLANDKGFIKAMADIAEKIGEDVIAGSTRTTMTPQEAQTQLNEMMMDKKGAFHNELHPEHEAAVEKFNDLQRMIMAGGTA
jgi:hypothetical protein